MAGHLRLIASCKKLAVTWMKCRTASCRLSAVITWMKEPPPGKIGKWREVEKKVDRGTIREELRWGKAKTVWIEKRSIFICWFSRKRPCSETSNFIRVCSCEWVRERWIHIHMDRFAGKKHTIPWCKLQRSIRTSFLRVLLLKDIAEDETSSPISKPIPNEVTRLQTGLWLSAAPTKTKGNVLKMRPADRLITASIFHLAPPDTFKAPQSHLWPSSWFVNFNWAEHSIEYHR